MEPLVKTMRFLELSPLRAKVLQHIVDALHRLVVLPKELSTGTQRVIQKSEFLIHANQQPHRSAARPPSPRLPLADPRHVITQVSSTTTLENA